MKKLFSKIFDNKKQEATAQAPARQKGFIDFATGKRVEIVNGREVFVD